MLPRALNRPVTATLSATAVGVAALTLGAATAAPSPSPTAVAAAERITRAGAGEVRLGMTFRELRDAGLVGRLTAGCELAGPDARSARLRSPLRGSVDFSQTSPRRATNIAIRGGATARGVGVGARRARIRAAFPRARFDRSTEEVFGITLVKIPRNGGGRLQFAVDVETRKVTLIGVPAIPFCE